MMTPEQHALLQSFAEKLSQDFEITRHPDTLEQLAELEVLLATEFQSGGNA